MAEIHITPNPDPAGPALRIQLDEAPPTPATVHYADHVRLKAAGDLRLTMNPENRAPDLPAPAQEPEPPAAANLAALLELLELLPDPAPCYKCRYCAASAAYGNEATARGCQEFALRAAFPPNRPPADPAPENPGKPA